MPILLKSLILEGRYEVGVIIAKVKDDDAQKIMDFNYGFIPEQVLYTQEFNHGREKEPHITVKYGLTESYSPNQIQDILRDINPFKVDVRGISTFNNPKFDVVKFDVDGKELRHLNAIFSKLPNKDTHPEYHGHLTLAYVKKGSGNRFIRPTSKIAKIEINEIIYSNKGTKSRYMLGYDNKT
jgi:hypothetical protein